MCAHIESDVCCYCYRNEKLSQQPQRVLVEKTRPEGPLVVYKLRPCLFTYIYDYVQRTIVVLYADVIVSETLDNSQKRKPLIFAGLLRT